MPVLAFALAVAVPPAAVDTPPGSVYRIAPVVDASVTAAGVLSIVIPYELSGTLIHPRCPCDPREVNAFDRHVIGNHNKFLDDLSDVTTGVAIGVPILLDALDLQAWAPFLEDAVVYAETLSVNGAFVTAAKYIVQRPLPRTYAGDPDLIKQPGGYRSFYSGHTSVVVAALSATAFTIGARYGQRVWPWVIVAAVGSMVAAERVAAGRHFYTDVAAGAVAGAAVGTLVPLAHEHRDGGGALAVRF